MMLKLKQKEKLMHLRENIINRPSVGKKSKNSTKNAWTSLVPTWSRRTVKTFMFSQLLPNLGVILS